MAEGGSQRGAVGDLEEGSVRVGGTAREKGGCLEYRPNHSAGQGGTSLTKHRLCADCVEGLLAGEEHQRRELREAETLAITMQARRGYAIGADRD